MKELQKTYPDRLPYLNIEKVFHDLIYKTLLDGLITSNVSNLEEYLIKIFTPYDSLENGIIHVNDIITALRISDKLMLSKVQLYIV